MLRHWHQVFSAALASQPLVGVYRTISEHVGREPTRSEVSAGRRAARTMAETGEAVLIKVTVAPSPGRRAVPMLVLARPGIDVSDPERLAEAASGQRQPGQAPKPAGNPGHVMPGMINTLRATAATGQLLDVSRATSDEAARLAAELAEPLTELAKLRNRLRYRARTR